MSDRAQPWRSKLKHLFSTQAYFRISPCACVLHRNQCMPNTQLAKSVRTPVTQHASSCASRRAPDVLPGIPPGGRQPTALESMTLSGSPHSAEPHSHQEKLPRQRRFPLGAPGPRNRLPRRRVRQEGGRPVLSSRTIQSRGLPAVLSWKLKRSEMLKLRINWTSSSRRRLRKTPRVLTG